MRNLFASCNNYTFQMIQIYENPPLFFYFLIQFSDWEVKAAKDFHMLNSFPFKNKVIMDVSIFAFSFGLTYVYYLCSVLKSEKTLSIFRFLIMFPLNLLSVCSMCMVCQPSVPWSAHTTYRTAAVHRHCPQLLYAVATTTNAAIVINRSRLS